MGGPEHRHPSFLAASIGEERHVDGEGMATRADELVKQQVILAGQVVEECVADDAQLVLAVLARLRHEAPRLFLLRAQPARHRLDVGDAAQADPGAVRRYSALLWQDLVHLLVERAVADLAQRLGVVSGIALGAAHAEFLERLQAEIADVALVLALAAEFCFLEQLIRDLFVANKTPKTRWVGESDQIAL